MYKTYLVTGATGFLGRTVVSELLSRGAAVRALVLPGDRLAGVLPESVERTEGDICSASALENFFAGTDESTCVIHTAGIVTVASRPDASLYRVNVDGTRAILRECAAHGIGKLVYISSVHALPEKPKGMTITETDAVSSEFVSGDYAKSKAEATSLVFAAAKNGLNASIVFPSGIIGPGDIAGGSMTTMFRSFLAGRLPLAVHTTSLMCATLPAASPTAQRTGSAAAVTFSPATIQRSAICSKRSNPQPVYGAR